MALLFSCRERDRGAHSPRCSVVVAKVLDNLVVNGMQLKVYRKEPRNQNSKLC